MSAVVSAVALTTAVVPRGTLEVLFGPRFGSGVSALPHKYQKPTEVTRVHTGPKPGCVSDHFDPDDINNLYYFRYFMGIFVNEASDNM